MSDVFLYQFVRLASCCQPQLGKVVARAEVELRFVPVKVAAFNCAGRMQFHITCLYSYNHNQHGRFAWANALFECLYRSRR